MPIVVHVQQCLDFVGWAEIAKTVLISQLGSLVTPACDWRTFLVLFVFDIVVLVIVICSTNDNS